MEQKKKKRMPLARIIFIVMACGIVVGFSYVGIKSFFDMREELDRKTVKIEKINVKLKTVDSELKKLQDGLTEEKNSNLEKQEKIQQLESEKQTLENEKQDLHNQLQAKKEREAQIAQASKLAKVASASSVSGGCIDWIRQAGVAESDVQTAYKLIMRESSCRVNATNKSSGAYGIPQSLPAGKMKTAGSDWRTNPITQIRWMKSYVEQRYGSWQNALNFHYSHNWY